MDPLRLRPLRQDDEREAMAAHAELALEDFEFLLERERVPDWPAYVQLMRSRRRGDDLPADRVPTSFLVVQVGPDLVGRVSVRHELNDYLARLGGHIGYAVRPAFRRRGHATELLRQALVVARAEGVERVLVTCEDGNFASSTVIERCGGVLSDVAHDADGQRTRRYWID